MGTLDAQMTAVSNMGFKFLLYDIPVAVVVFFAWSVGESYARERWGERLASFDALLRRDVLNASVGRSLLRGVLTAPALAAAVFVTSSIPLALKLTAPSIGGGLTPTDPYLYRMLFEFGGICAAILIFLAYDLLTTAVAIFGGSMIALSAPLLSVARGHQFEQLLSATSLPMLALLVLFGKRGPIGSVLD